MDMVIFILVLVAIFILGAFVLPQIRIRRAIRSVIRIFEHHNAIGVKGAKPIEELGLAPKPMFQRILKPRDYKAQALQVLLRADIVQVTEDDKLYLSEESLTTIKWRGR